MRLTLGDVKASSIPQRVGLAACDARFTQMLNEAQQRLVMGPDLWWELTAKYEICAWSGRVTWPRFVANPITIAVNRRPYPVRNGWFEFLESGYGLRCTTSPCEWQAFDAGTVCTFDDIDTESGNKKLKLYSTVAEASGMTFGVLGYDQSGEWIRTQVGGVWTDGEWFTVPTDPLTPYLSSFYWSTVTSIIKPVTAGDLKLFEYDPATITQRQIGLYEADETRPHYRRSLIGGYENTTEAVTVSAIVKKEFIPVRHGYDNDQLMIGNLPALKEMMTCIAKEEADNLEAAAVHEAKARRIMDDEASHYLGPAQKVPLRIDGDNYGLADVPYVQ